MENTDYFKEFLTPNADDLRFICNVCSRQFTEENNVA